MTMKTVSLFFVLSVNTMNCFNVVNAQVVKSAADGFQIKIIKTAEADSKSVYACLVNDFSKWWDARHSYSGEAENLRWIWRNAACSRIFPTAVLCVIWKSFTANPERLCV